MTCITTIYKATATPSFTITTVDDSGDPANPSSFTVTHTTPEQVTTVYTSGVDAQITNPSTGTFIFTAPASVAPTAGADTGKIVVTTVSGGRTDVDETYYRVETP